MRRLDFSKASTEFLPVGNFPARNESFFDLTSAVFVQKFKRIYIFGGYTYNGFNEFYDSIWYVDLPSPPFPAFDCLNLTDGSYPHPTDCSSYYVCKEGELVGEYTCQIPLFFDPIEQTCNFPEDVVCFFTCEGTAAGLHAHPSDCSKYIVCTEGQSRIDVYDCPEPLLFNPLLMKCDLPQFVECS
jgi:hypothetical protein